MSFSATVKANGAPVNPLTGFEGSLRGRGKIEERKKGGEGNKGKG